MKIMLKLFLSVFVFFSWSCASPNAKTDPAKEVPKTKQTQIQNQAEKMSPPVKTDSPAKKSILANKLESHTCKRKQDVRSIWVEKLDPKGCKLWYSHYSKGGPAATSFRGNEYCLNIQRNIIGNLGMAGFACAQD